MVKGKDIRKLPGKARARVQAVAQEWAAMPVLEAMTEIARQGDGVTIWDPARKLCSPSACNAMHGDKPLFFDGDHLSGYGNEVLYPHFRNYIHQRIASAN